MGKKDRFGIKDDARRQDEKEDRAIIDHFFQEFKVRSVVGITDPGHGQVKETCTYQDVDNFIHFDIY